MVSERTIHIKILSGRFLCELFLRFSSTKRTSRQCASPHHYLNCHPGDIGTSTSADLQVQLSTLSSLVKAKLAIGLKGILTMCVGEMVYKLLPM